MKNNPNRSSLRPLAAVLMLAPLLAAARPTTAPVLSGQQAWTSTPPLAGPVDRGGDHFYAIKDPSVVRDGGKWHLFCTVRGRDRHLQMEYLTFDDFNAVDKGERHLLPIFDAYYCAPEVFHFSPQDKWYMIYQYQPGGRDGNKRVPGFSTNQKVGDWKNWTKPQPLYPPDSPTTKKFGGSWIDFWVICDAKKAHLFFTRDNGELWRADTKLADFPIGWGEPVRVMKADIFEASCTYAVKGTGKFLTIIECVGPDGRRYFKSYGADKLDGEWTPLAASWAHPFAGTENVRQPAGHWTDSISHGELIRAGTDETLEVDPADVRFLYQGVSAADMAGKPYGEIPWRLAILRPEEK